MRTGARSRYQTAMRALSGAPRRVGAHAAGGVGSAVPPQLTTPSAVRHAVAALTDGRGRSCGTAKIAALTRAPRSLTGLRLLRSVPPPIRSARCSAGRSCEADSTLKRTRAVPGGISRPGTHTGWRAAARATYPWTSTLSVPVL